MKLCDINPYMRYAELQPSIMSSAPLSCSYDYRIFYIVDGKTTLVLEYGIVDLDAGALVYLPSGTPYYFDGKVKVIVFNFDLTREFSDIKKPIPKSKDIKSFDFARILENSPPNELKEAVVLNGAYEIEGKLEKCMMHYSYPTDISDALTSGIIKEILCYVIENKSVEYSVESEIVKKIILVIQQNYDKELSNSQIASELGYHSYYLNRVFKRKTGATIHQAVIKEKIRIAKRLLIETNLSIASVAREVGFEERSQFCTAFRKYTGYTPTEYRNKRG